MTVLQDARCKKCSHPGAMPGWEGVARLPPLQTRFGQQGLIFPQKNGQD